jgi:hypothetical protein
MFGQGDWMQSGSPFTNGEMLDKVKGYVSSIKTTVNHAVTQANGESRNVQWTASFSNWLRSADYFGDSRDIATTDLSTKSTAVMNRNGAVASFNVNLHVDINWNASKSAYFQTALRTDNMSGASKERTGEIAHTRDAATALTSSYAGYPPARAIANEAAASMVGQPISADTASLRMDAALVEWVHNTKNESRRQHDRPGDHWY